MAEQNASINGSTGGNNLSVMSAGEREFYERLDLAEPVFVCIISVVQIPIMIVTLFALCVLIKSHRSAPVFVINLILSDLIQIICKLIWTFIHPEELIFAYIYSFLVGLYFMACVAVERYLLVSHPIWYKTHHSLKVCCVISVIIWFVPLIFLFILGHLPSVKILPELIIILIPYLIIILCFVGTYRGLSHAISLTPLKRKLILGSLFLVLLTYTFIILPSVILSFIRENYFNSSLLLLKVLVFSIHLLYVNPLADCILYLFIRPDVGGLMESVHCCCRTGTHQNSTHSRDEHSRDISGTFACCVSVQKPASHSQTACSSV